jgi:molybdopterin molybdotransferase
MSDQVTIRLPRVLRRLADDRREVTVAAGTVGEALDALVAAYPAVDGSLRDAGGDIAAHLLLFAEDAELPRSGYQDVPLPAGATLSVLAPLRGGAEDVRMRGFRVRTPVAEARAAALDGVARLEMELIEVTAAARRVLAAPAVSEVDVPPFRRATMDGYAVVAADTHGASMYNPVPLRLDGESMPGREIPGPLAPGTARRIMTGAPLPGGADAVVRAEDAGEQGPTVEITAGVAAGKNVGRVGEDVAAGTEVLPAGRRIRPEDAAVLASIGLSPVPVVRRPRVRIVVSGNELLAPGSRPDGTRIVDSNSVMLAALARRDGGEIEAVERLPDDRDAIGEALARPGADVVVTAGGVSVGREDFLPGLVAERGDLVVHGVAMRPSSPTGIGRIGGVPVLLLPGNPVSCLSAYDFFAGPVIRTMAGLPAGFPYPVVRLPLAGRLVSQIGRVDYARVRIAGGRVHPIAVSGASVLSSVTGADGFVIVPEGSEGFGDGTEVEVHRYDTWPAS